jgi:hypothetical protein
MRSESRLEPLQKNLESEKPPSRGDFGWLFGKCLRVYGRPYLRLARKNPKGVSR